MYDPNRPRLNSGGQEKPGYLGSTSKPAASSSPSYMPGSMPSVNNYKPPTGGYGPAGNNTVQNNFANRFK